MTEQQNEGNDDLYALMRSLDDAGRKTLAKEIGRRHLDLQTALRESNLFEDEARAWQLIDDWLANPGNFIATIIQLEKGAEPAERSTGYQNLIDTMHSCIA
jgi:hypothetical protein